MGLEEGKTGVNVDLSMLVKFMREEKILRLKTTNTEIEMHPCAFIEKGGFEDKHEEVVKDDLSQEEKVGLAKKYFNEMIGGI